MLFYVWISWMNFPFEIWYDWGLCRKETCIMAWLGKDGSNVELQGCFVLWLFVKIGKNLSSIEQLDKLIVHHVSNASNSLLSINWNPAHIIPSNIYYHVLAATSIFFIKFVQCLTQFLFLYPFTCLLCCFKLSSKVLNYICLLFYSYISSFFLS